MGNLCVTNNIIKKKKKEEQTYKLGMNLSGSQQKATLTRTVPGSIQVVYKKFPKALN
jgi:hypothetical protein